MSNSISNFVIRRLPKYLRVLEQYVKLNVDRVSSKELAIKLGSTASQVRQDFNCFGDFGQNGYGYKVSDLYNKIKSILGLDKKYSCIVIGAGNLGQAIVSYPNFSEIGFKVQAIFDINPKIIGLSIRGIEVLDVDSLQGYIQEHKIDIAILCIPESQVKKIYEMVIDKIKGVWNFSTVDLNSSNKTIVENVNINDGLFTLVYFMNKTK